jgi:murein DD-endopeptidase MepM/ murein hydrolase activator NlpD
MGKVLRVRAGSKFSRFFRYIFEHKRIKKILGTNIALIVVLSSFVPARATSDIEPEQIVISEETTPLITQSGIQYPVEKIKITQGYKFYHPGIDLDGITGDLIQPVMTGVVENISYSRFAYGNAVIVNHGNKITSLYAHLSKIEVEKGQEVTIKTKLGEMGATGQAWGDHLHLEIRDHNYPINPLSVLPH